MHNKILSHTFAEGQLRFIILHNTNKFYFEHNITLSLRVLSLILSLSYDTLLGQELSISHIDSSTMSALNN